MRKVAPYHTKILWNIHPNIETYITITMTAQMGKRIQTQAP